MKPSEAKVLEGLRKTTLAYLSDKEYAEVVEAVEKQGILGLTGAASRLVKGAVAKHGSHDQKTHGRKGGGGGGSGGGGASGDSSQQKAFEEKVKSEISQLADRAKSIDDDLSNNPQDDRTRDRAKSAMNGVRQEIENASRGKTTASSRESLSSARTKIKPIMDSLEDQNYHSDVRNLDSLRLDITSLMTIMGRGKF